MNTPAHLIFGAAAFGKPGQAQVTWAAILGSIAPDLSLYVMATWSIFIAGTDPSIVFGEYYYSTNWQRVFAVDNSFVLWGLGFALAFWAQKPVLITFAGAWLLHLAFDFPLHNHDARMHFWPLTDWRFVSPLSYWDSRFHANIVSRMELIVTFSLAVLLLIRFQRIPARLLILLAVLAELSVTGMFRLLF